MAFVRVRHASIFVGGKKLGTMFNNKYSINSGDEPQFGDNGLLGYSDGAIQTTLTCTDIIPVAGQDVPLTQALVAKSDLDMQVGLVDGHIHQITMRPLKAEFDSDAKAGTQHGNFEFGGGTPRIV